MAASDQRSAWQPALPLEMALAQLVSESATPATGEQEQAVQPAASIPAVPTRAEKTHKAASSKAETAPTPASQPPAPKIAAEQPAVSQSEAQPVSDEASIPTQNTSAVELQTILENWQKIRQRVKAQSSPVDGLLNSCKSITIRNGVLQLGFGSDVLKTMMEKGNNLKITRKAIRDVLGVEVDIACVVVQGKGSQMQLDADIEADGMVSTAIRLGGKIVHKE